MPSDYTISFVAGRDQIGAVDRLAEAENRTRSSMLRHLIDIGLAYYQKASPTPERAVRVLTQDGNTLRNISPDAVVRALAQALREERIAPVPAGAADADLEA